MAACVQHGGAVRVAGGDHLDLVAVAFLGGIILLRHREAARPADGVVVVVVALRVDRPERRPVLVERLLAHEEQPAGAVGVVADAEAVAVLEADRAVRRRRPQVQADDVDADVEVLGVVPVHDLADVDGLEALARGRVDGVRVEELEGLRRRPLVVLVLVAVRAGVDRPVAEAVRRGEEGVAGPVVHEDAGGVGRAGVRGGARRDGAEDGQDHGEEDRASNPPRRVARGRRHRDAPDHLLRPSSKRGRGRPRRRRRRHTPKSPADTAARSELSRKIRSFPGSSSLTPQTMAHCASPVASTSPARA